MERRGSRLSRRQFVVGAGSAALLAGCGRLPWQAQTPTKVQRVGWLHFTPNPPAGLFEDAFREGLRPLGYVEGQNIAIEFRYAQGSLERQAAMLAELMALGVDVLVAVSDQDIHAAKQATTTIPVVMLFANDPVEQGLISSLARPGGNLTGLSNLSGQLVSKRLELLQATV